MNLKYSFIIFISILYFSFDPMRIENVLVFNQYYKYELITFSEKISIRNINLKPFGSLKNLEIIKWNITESTRLANNQKSYSIKIEKFNKYLCLSDRNEQFIGSREIVYGSNHFKNGSCEWRFEKDTQL